MKLWGILGKPSSSESRTENTCGSEAAKKSSHLCEIGASGVRNLLFLNPTKELFWKKAIHPVKPLNGSPCHDCDLTAAVLVNYV
jgi:hypothetical protein